MFLENNSEFSTNRPNKMKRITECLLCFAGICQLRTTYKMKKKYHYRLFPFKFICLFYQFHVLIFKLRLAFKYIMNGKRTKEELDYGEIPFCKYIKRTEHMSQETAYIFNQCWTLYKRKFFYRCSTRTRMWLLCLLVSR